MEGLTGVVTGYVGKAVVAALTKLLAGTGYDPLSVAGRLHHHVAEVSSWSEHVQQFGTPEPLETDSVTVRLRMFQGLKRDNRDDAPLPTKSEVDLLSDKSHFLILGQPGAGKTTTLKRLVRRLLSEEPVGEADVWQYPIAIRLREIPASVSLNAMIAAVLGITAERRQAGAEESPKAPISHAPASTEPLLYVGDLTLQQFVVDFLNLTSALVLLDGIDEVDVERRSKLYDEIIQLAYLLRGSKIVATCRTGDYQRTFADFKLVELCPLNDEEITQIARRLLPEPAQFLVRLRELPYSDTADRPLLLSQLAFIYQRYGYLPEQPSLIYRKIVTLLLQEWDAQRGVIRRSGYAGFDADRKAEFLSALAFHLTFVVGARRFSERDLRQAYEVIYASFALPRTEAAQVAAELETHTGLIAAAGLDHFEFAHLSLQEYLCANYIVRDPFTPNIDQYLRENPDPLAVAVTLASNPANWFASLMLRHARRGKLPARSLQNFLARLLIEQPLFEISAVLGVAIMKLLHDFPSARVPELAEYLHRIQEVPNVVESMRVGLTLYSSTDRWSATPEMIELYSSSSMVDGWDIPLPDTVSVPTAIYKDFLGSDHEKLLEHLYKRPRQVYEPKEGDPEPEGRRRRG